jgi:hypothetical protein
MIRKSGNRLPLATNAKGVCAEIMLKQKVPLDPDSTQLKQALGNGNQASYRPKEQIDSLDASLCIRA